MNSKVNIIIVEDELILAQDIANRLSNNHYKILGIATSVDDAIKLLESNSVVDILIIDIALKGNKDGIDLAVHINNNYELPFIFLTSHSEKHIIDRAKRVKPNAYLLKPYNNMQVQVAIEMALVDYSKTTTEKISKPNDDDDDVLNIKNCLFLKKNNHFEKVPYDEILYLEADNNYCTIYTKTKKYIYSIVMKKIEQTLPYQHFTRIHRSYVVNINCIKGFEGNQLYIENKKLPISRSQREKVFKLFNTI